MARFAARFRDALCSSRETQHLNRYRYSVMTLCSESVGLVGTLPNAWFG
jgi:hypothetical protein